MKYRRSRAIEASLIDYIKMKLSLDNWKDINVEKSFARVYKLKLPVIAVHVGNTRFNKLEVGTNAMIRNPLIFIDVFGSDDSIKWDLTDWLISNLKNGFPYYDYSIEKDETGSRVVEKREAGHIYLKDMYITEVVLSEDKSELDEHDRYRVRITLDTSLNIIE